MAQILSGRQQTSNIIANEISFGKKSNIAVVYDIILDDTHPHIKKGKAKVSDIGAIIYRMLDDLATPITDLSMALPYDNYGYKAIPVINEQVEIITTGLGRFYKKIEPGDTPNNSAAINLITTKFENRKATTNNSISDANVSYRESFATKIPQQNNTNLSSYNKLGKYFQFTSGIHKLKLYEGDSLIETRFGQSLRFSAYNNAKNNLSPTIILRNSESSLNRIKEFTENIEEDVNRDGSILLMGSNQYELPFLPGTVNKNGTSDFQTKPDSFKDYPKKLIGDQLLLNSGRIILSAKNAEMIFYSKKNYGFISDGALSIDNKLGIEASVGGDINVITNNRDVTFYTGTGNISLGDVDREPMVKGKQLKALLEDLIAAILNQTFLTPSGPSAMGPENFNDFIQLNDRINDILSKQNSTS